MKRFMILALGCMLILSACGGDVGGGVSQAKLVINEVDYSDSGTDNLEFIEIFNAGGSAQSLVGISLVLVDGAVSPATVYQTIDLSDGGAIPSLASGEYLVVAGNAGSLNTGGAAVIDMVTDDLIVSTIAGIAIHDTGSDELLDALSYNGSINMAQIGATVFNLVEGTPTGQVDNEEDFSFIVTTANPGGFVDIAATGLALGISDDGEVNFTNSVTNSLWTGTTTRIANNGGIINADIGDLWAGNSALPAGNLEASSVYLLPYWDDIGDGVGNVYVEELQINGIDALVVQWDNRSHWPASAGVVTFQVQVFASGPVLARYAYKDVVFEDVSQDNGASATIGVQTDITSPPGQFVQYSFDTVGVFDDDTIDVLAGKSLGRYPNGSDTGDAATDFVLSGASPGAVNL